jgi:hypothetical protein
VELGLLGKVLVPMISSVHGQQDSQYLLPPESISSLVASNPAVINVFVVKLHCFGVVMLTNSGKARN